MKPSAVVSVRTQTEEFCSQHMNKTDLPQVDPVTHSRVSFTTWFADTKLELLVLSQFWTVNAAVHTEVRELEFSSVHVPWTHLTGKMNGRRIARCTAMLRKNYTPWVKKTRHQTLGHNFTNYYPIFKIFSLADSAVICNKFIFKYFTTL